MGSCTIEDCFSYTILSNFDVDLQRFYLKALNKELVVQNEKNARDIKRALKEVVEAYKKPTGRTNPAKTSIRFDSSSKRCAYVLKHSPCFTSAVSRHFLRLVKNCSKVFEDLMVRGEIRVCCLGGGPASDAVGICKILSALNRPFWIKSQRSLKVKVTIVDVNQDWAVTARNVLETLKERSDILGIEGIDLCFQFLTADLTQPMSEGVRKAMKESDLLTMVYFLSAVNGGRDRIESLRMVMEIMKTARDGSILFFLDSAMEVHYKQMSSAATWLGCMAQICGPCIEEFHTLSLESVKTFIDLYKIDFGKFLCLTNCFVSSGSWLKQSICCELNSVNTHGNLNNRHLDSHVVKSDSLISKPCKFNCKTANQACDMCESDTDKSDTFSGRVSKPSKSVGKTKKQTGKSKVAECACQSTGSKLSMLEERIVAGNSILGVEEDLMWRKSQRRSASRLTERMVQFRARVAKLLFTEFEQMDSGVEIELFDEVESTYEDAIDNLVTQYCRFVPEYFFQTKSKKKRIFTGLPIAI